MGMDERADLIAVLSTIKSTCDQVCRDARAVADSNTKLFYLGHGLGVIRTQVDVLLEAMKETRAQAEKLKPAPRSNRPECFT